MSDFVGQEDFARLSRTCPELKALPQEWTWRVDTTSNNRIYFQKIKTGEKTLTHPTKGGLPGRWIFHIRVMPNGAHQAVFYNREESSDRFSIADPRVSREAASKAQVHVDHKRDADLSQWHRDKIEEKDISYKFKVIHTIDGGVNAKPGEKQIGGMNGGVHVVTMNGLANRLFVRKGFTAEQLQDGAKLEIEITHRVKHSALAMFTGGYILGDQDAALYLEFCDRGSIQDMMGAYFHQAKKLKPPTLPQVPEGFLWQAFLGLTDALAYLETGNNSYSKEASTTSGWIPIIHRDIKPDNVLLRSRSTSGATNYFYCIISDFGIACEDYPSGHPKEDHWQKRGGKLGTSLYWAPELLYNPYPRLRPGKTDDDRLIEMNKFPDGYRHTKKSDLWSVAAVVSNLACATQDKYSHLDMSRIDRHPELKDLKHYGASISHAVVSRKAELPVPEWYSWQLMKAVHKPGAWYIKQRPGPSDFINELRQLAEASEKYDLSHSYPLPEWATREHEYHHRAETLK